MLLVLLLWEGFPGLMLVVDIYHCALLLLRIVVAQDNLVKLFRYIYMECSPQSDVLLLSQTIKH